MWLKKLACVEFLLACCLSTALQADITVIQLANSGYVVEAGGSRVMIDGMVVEPYAVYGGLAPEVAEQFFSADGDFADIDLALVSHRHHEHNQPEFACRFMQASRSTQLHSSGQVIGLMREFCREFITTSPRVLEIDPQYGVPVVIERDGAKVTVFPLSHGTRKDARIQNFGHLVEVGGMTVLHIGDATMDPVDFERAGLEGIRIDVAMIPFWFFQPGPGGEIVKRFLDAPTKIAMHIPPSEMAEVQAYMEAAYPQVVVLERPLQRARFSAGARPSPQQ